MEFQTPYRSPANEVLAQEATRAFMTRVYGWMFGGLLVSGIASVYAARSEQLMGVVFARPFIPFLVMLGFTWFVGPRLAAMTAPVAGALFLAYSAMMGVFLAPIFFVYELGSITSIFTLAAAMFGALSVFGMVTKKDLSGWGTFLFMGAIGYLGMSVFHYFFPSGMLNFLIGCVGVTVFAGLTAYDTQKLKAFGAEAEASGAHGMAVGGALHLYLDFINLFLSLLRLFGNRR